MVGVAVNVTELPGHTDVVGVLITTDGVTVGLTVMVMVSEVAVAGMAQVAVELITQYTFSPFVSAEELYVAPVPTAVPPTNH